jgi:hypothetical protein
MEMELSRLLGTQNRASWASEMEMEMAEAT